MAQLKGPRIPDGGLKEGGGDAGGRKLKVEIAISFSFFFSIMFSRWLLDGLSLLFYLFLPLWYSFC